MCLISHSKQHLRIFLSIFVLVPTKLAFCYLRGLYCHHLCKELLWFWYSVHRCVRSNPLISLWMQQSKLDRVVVLENCIAFARFCFPMPLLIIKRLQISARFSCFEIRNSWFLLEVSFSQKAFVKNYMYRVPTRSGKPGKMRVHLENLEISWNFEKFNKYHGKMTWNLEKLGGL